MAAEKNQVDEKAILALVASSGELRAEINRQAKRIATAANATLRQRQDYPDYDTGQHTHKDGMPGATVYTRSNHAKYAEAKRNSLVRVLG